MFQKYRTSIDLPFFHSFPTNCCESASIFLGKFLADRYPNSAVLIVIGTNSASEQHFWVEINDLVFDITADQYKNISAPIYGKKTHPLEKTFTKTIKILAEEAFQQFDLASDDYKIEVINNINVNLNEAL